MASAQSALVERAKKIIVTPTTEWPVVDAEPSSIGDIYRNYIFPLAAIPVVARLIGDLLFGVSVLGITVRKSPAAAIGSAISLYILSLFTVFVLALIIDALAPTFGGTRDRTRAFKVAAYSATPVWLAGALDILPQLAPLAFLLGLYNLYLQYLGLPLLMRAPADKAVGYMVAVFVALAVVLFGAAVIFVVAGRLLSPAMTIV